MNAPDKAVEIKAALTAVIAFLTSLWGWLGWAVIIFGICMILDWITGSLAARSKGEWSSTAARQGLWHKLGEIVALLVAALCDIAIAIIINTAAAPLLGGFEYRNYLTLIVSIWYIFTELGSIIENAEKLGAPVPAWLLKVIGHLKKQADETEIIN